MARGERGSGAAGMGRGRALPYIAGNSSSMDPFMIQLNLDVQIPLTVYFTGRNSTKCTQSSKKILEIRWH